MAIFSSLSRRSLWIYLFPSVSSFFPKNNFFAYKKDALNKIYLHSENYKFSPTSLFSSLCSLFSKPLNEFSSFSTSPPSLSVTLFPLSLYKKKRTLFLPSSCPSFAYACRCYLTIFFYLPNYLFCFGRKTKKYINRDHYVAKCLAFCSTFISLMYIHDAQNKKKKRLQPNNLFSLYTFLPRSLLKNALVYSEERTEILASSSSVLEYYNPSVLNFSRDFPKLNFTCFLSSDFLFLNEDKDGNLIDEKRKAEKEENKGKAKIEEDEMFCNEGKEEEEEIQCSNDNPQYQYYQELNEYSDIQLFTGSNDVELAREICAYLGVALGRAYVDKYSDGEVAIQVMDEVRGRDVYIIQSCAGKKDMHTSFMEFLLLASSLRRSSAKRITAIIPYLCYARQMEQYDVNRPRPIAAADVALLLHSVGVDRFIFMDLHNQRLEGCFPDPVPVINIQPQGVAIEYFRKKQLQNPVVVATGNMEGERAKAFWTRMKHSGFMNVGFTTMVSSKHRRAEEDNDSDDVTSADPRTFSLNSRGEIKIKNAYIPPPLGHCLVGDVRDCDCIIVDDIIDTAETAEITARHLKAKGASRIFLYATHGLFSKDAIEKLNVAPIDEVIVTNTVCIPSHVYREKLKIISVGKLIAEAIKRIHNENSVSVIFKDEYFDRLARRERDKQ